MEVISSKVRGRVKGLKYTVLSPVYLNHRANGVGVCIWHATSSSSEQLAPKFRGGWVL